MRKRGTAAALGLAALTVAAAGCMTAGGVTVHAMVPLRRPIAEGRVVGRVRPLDIAARVDAKLIGEPPTSWTPTRLAMATDQIGFAAGVGPGVGASPYLALGTTDGGQSFSLLFVALQPIVAVQAPDAGHAFFLEQDCVNGGVCSSTLQLWRNGASSPLTLWQGRTDAVLGFSFPTATDGYIAAARTWSNPPSESIYATHDGGRSFLRLPSPCANWYPPASGALSFYTASAGWLLCGAVSQSPTANDVKLLATTDGGDHWVSIGAAPTAGQSVPSPPVGAADALWTESAESAYLSVGGSGVLMTQDGGHTWHRPPGAKTPGLSAVTSLGFLPGGFGWLLSLPLPGLEETMDGGRDWRTVGKPAPLAPAFDMDVSTLANGVVYALAAAPYPGYAPDNVLLASLDGGRTFARVAALGTWLGNLDVLSPQDLVAAENVPDGSYVAESGDGGAHWRRDRLPAGWSVGGLGFASPGQGWVTAYDPRRSPGFTIFRCGPGTCGRLRTPFTPGLARMTGPFSGFAVGMDERQRYALFATADAGGSWREGLLPRDLAFGAAGAAGNVRWLYQSDAMPPPMGGLGPSPASHALVSGDSGRTWREIRFPAGAQEVASLSFTDSLQGLLVTFNPITGTSLWSTDDGGGTFRLLP